MAGMEHGQNGSHGPASKTHCTCLGDCCGSAPPSPPSAVVAVVPQARVVRVAPLIVAAANPAPVASPPHSRPFANGPPSLDALLG